MTLKFELNWIEIWEWLENEGQRLHKCHHTEHAVGPHLYNSVGNWCISDITRNLSPKLIAVT